MKSETIKTRYGVMNIPSADGVLGPSLRLYGEWAQDEVEGLNKLLKDGDIVIDAGANIGTHTLGFASAVAPNGCVYAFEPQSDIHELLKRNCSENSNFANVVTYCNPLSSSSGQRYSIPHYDDFSVHNYGATQLTPAKDESNSGLRSLESMAIDDLDLKTCRLIKIDVEGMELEVLSGATGLIKRCRPLILFEANTVAAAWEIIQNIAPIGDYLASVVISDAFSPSNFNENNINIFSDYQEASIILYSREEGRLVNSAFGKSIHVTNRAELAVALAVLCHRPPGHPLENFPFSEKDCQEVFNDRIDGLATPILNELIYQLKKKMIVIQQNGDLNKENTKLILEKNNLMQDKTLLGENLESLQEQYLVLSKHLQKYQDFPFIRVARKLKHALNFLCKIGDRN